MRYFTHAAARRRVLLIGLVGAILFMVAGFAVGWLWMGHRYPMLKEPAFQNFAVSYNTIMDKYLNGADGEDLINGASEGMVASLEDPYSRYLIEEQGDAYTQGYEGEFSGIGAEVREQDGQFVISGLTPGAPAERGGVKSGDIIMAVDGKESKDSKFQDLIGLMRGKSGTEVTLTLQRPGQTEPIEITLKREAIPVYTVTSEMLEAGIGHITISRFAQKTATEFDEAVTKLKEQGMTKLLLDLRSNPGGLLQPTIAIGSKLIPKGKVILEVVYKEESNPIVYKSTQKEEWTIPIVVLVNGQSASASEVLTAALKESAGATVVGEKTYGKGVVQAFEQFRDGSVLSLTEAQWKTPAGTWIHKVGVMPNEVVGLPAFASLRPLPVGSELKNGSYGEDVKTLQSMLKELGYAPVGKDGLFDDETEAAMRAFQKAEKLDVTGSLNDKTAYQIVELLKGKLEKEDTQLQRGVELLKK
ncbi:peptidase S41 [Paenibacillus sp. BIHB 4019]|uniref:Peptidase S41 n=1 Tax=Paenibacillus sp. BIHB 4019 TaxID=1870819 RepID=A0A1B2DJV6_9BACL|nr:S41 family peptidase [Paenibacillus sp. BIHB 4019]ANY67988.1 peptidase S41 [Paenibacillus sp. BIHB 4019]